MEEISLGFRVGRMWYGSRAVSEPDRRHTPLYGKARTHSLLCMKTINDRGRLVSTIELAVEIARRC
jgi:hypothetical protein